MTHIKHFILLHTLLMHMICGATNRIDIYLSFNECVNCYVNLSALSSFPGYEKTIMIHRPDSIISGEFLEGYQLQQTIRHTYLPGQAPEISYCKVFINNTLKDSFPLSGLYSKVNQVNRYLQNEPKTIKAFHLPKNTVLKSDRFTLSVNGPYINAYDYVLNKNITFFMDPSKDTLTKLSEIRGAQFPQHLFLRLGSMDSVLYDNCFPILQKTGKSTAHIEGSYLSDSSLFLLLNFPWVRIKPTNANDTVIGVSFFLYEKNLVSGAKKLSHVNYKPMMERYGSSYDFDNSRPFFVKAGKPTFSLLNDGQPGKPVYVLADYIPDGKNRFSFSDLNPLKYDNTYYTNNSIDGYEMSINKRYYFSNKLKVIIDHTSSDILYLKNFELPESSFGLDVTDDKNLLKMLVLDKTELEVVVYDLKKQVVVTRTKKELPADCALNSVKFYDPKTIIFFNKDLAKASLMSIEK